MPVQRVFEVFSAYFAKNVILVKDLLQTGGFIYRYIHKHIKGVVWAKTVKIIKFLFFAQKVSSGMGASHPFEIIQRFQNCFFFHSSIKTEEVLFFYIYILYIYIYLYIYKKLSPKWKNCHEQKVFLFRFYILFENFSKIGPIIKKWGAMGVHRGCKFDFFQCLFSLFIYLFI